MIPQPPMDMNSREAVLMLWGVTRIAQDYLLQHRKVLEQYTIRSLHTVIWYSCKYPSRRKRTSMNIDNMVKEWVTIIRALCVAHDKKDVDVAEFNSEQHLAPFLAAPVAQLRTFHSALVEALKADPSIPFFVWSAFEIWDEEIVRKAPDGEIKQLKLDLAAQIAEMVEKDVAPDIKDAIAGALKWRPEETLEKIKDAVQQGAKPRLRGKESCLFLVVNEGTPQEEMVML